MPNVVQGFEQGADGIVMLEHAIGVLAVGVRVTATVLGADVRSQVHACPVEQAEERLACRLLRFM